MVWGKIIGGVAGLVMGGPFGAVVGAALGHAADQGGLHMPFGAQGLQRMGATALLGGRQQLFSVGVVVLAARLARCDGPVNRQEIDGFKRGFRVPAEAARDIGRLFDQARDSREDVAPIAHQMGEAFAGLKVSVFLEVEGAAHYLPAYAGNLDIMTSAALKTAERIAQRQGVAA